MKKTIYLLFPLILLLLFGKSNLTAQCIPPGPEPIFGTVNIGSGSQTFTNMPTGTMIQVNAPAAGTFYTFSMCPTNGGVPQADGVDDSQLTILDQNNQFATDLEYNDDFCPTTGPDGFGPSQVNYTAPSAGTFFVYLTEWAPGSCTADGANSSYIMQVTVLGTPPTCEAGTLTSPSSFIVCEGETGELSVVGNSTPEDYTIGFVPGATGTGGNTVGFSIIGVTSSPFTFDNDVNGILSSNSLPPLNGEWILTWYSTNGADINCDSTATTSVTFLSSTDPACGGSGTPTCNNGDVDPALVGSVQNYCPGGSITLGTNGNEVIPAGETYGYVFQSTTFVDSFYIINGPPSFTGDLNAQLVDPIPFDSYQVFGFVTDSAQTVICGGQVSDNFISINILDSNDPICSGVVTPCLTAENIYTDFNTAGGAPCNDGANCTPTQLPFAVWSSEAYQMNGVQAGFDYDVSICSGAGAGSWDPVITIVTPSGTVETFAANCALSFTASESGQYTIVITEEGEACNAPSNGIDNGVLTVSCGTNPATCVFNCDAGDVAASLNGTIIDYCPGGTITLGTDGSQGIPNGELYIWVFENVITGDSTLLNFGINYTGDVNADLGAGNEIPFGPYTVTGTVTENGQVDLCGSGSTPNSFIINVLESSNPTCSAVLPCDITNITTGAQTACNPADNTYTQAITVTYSNPPASGQLSVNGQTFNITSSPQTVTLTGLNANGAAVNVTAFFSVDPLCSITSNNLFTAPASCAVVPCEITNITAGSQTACNPADNTYTQAITVTYSNPPASGQLSVNGQNFNITSSPQTVTLTGLDSDGASVNVTAFFSVDPLCSITSNNLFTAPASCAVVPCEITDVTAGSQTACNVADNTYTQQVTVTYSNPPASGQLSVNGQNFNITSSPQTVTLTGLDSDGASVNVTASFTADGTCTLTSNNLFTAPASCQCPTINYSVSTEDDVCDQNTGCINVTGVSGGVTPYTYSLDGGTSQSTGEFCSLASGSYDITITDANNCDTTFSVNVSADTYNLNVTVNTTNVNNCNTPDGSATANVSNGSSPYSYAWTPSTFGNNQTISNLPSGSYSVVVTDDNGCTGNASDNVNNAAGVNAAIDNTENVSCFGGNDGEIAINTLGGTAPITYNWNDQGFPSTVSTRSNLLAGSYTITINDGAGCSFVLGPIQINEPNQLVVGLNNSENVTCFGGSNGSITMNVSGGTTPYDYSWSGSTASTLNLSNLQAGNYQLEVTDNNDCIVEGPQVTITQPTQLNIQLVSGSLEDVSCNGFSDGSFEVLASGGTAPYNYNIGGSNQASGLFDNLDEDNYTATVIDDNGCTNDIEIEIDEPNALSASIVNVQNASSASATDGSATVNVIGGTTPYEYVWTPSNEINASASQLSVGTNTVVVTDANDCSITAEVEISFTNSVQNLQLDGLKLFPVPASEQVSLQFNTSEKEISFRVVNTLGATMHAENIDTKSGVFAETLNVSNFASGVYFIHLVGKDKASSLSFVVNK